MKCALEIFPRLLVGPSGRVRRQSLEMEGAIPLAVACVAASVARPRLEENRLHIGFVKLKIEGRGYLCWAGLRARLLGGCWDRRKRKGGGRERGGQVRGN